MLLGVLAVTVAMVGLAALDRLSRGRTLRDWLTRYRPRVQVGFASRLADAAVIATLLLLACHQRHLVR